MNYTTVNEIKDESIPELIKNLKTSENGLSISEAQKRLEDLGPNEIPEKSKSTIIKFLNYFWGPIPCMIEVAAVLSAIINHWEDFSIILMLLFINAIVGFIQEHKADNAIELLKQRLAPNARVKRDGIWRVIPSRELVRGDLIRVRLGDIIPADIKLFQGNYLITDESALTGESLPVEKKLNDLAYSGSIVRQGEMDAFIVSTGVNTFFGKTTKLIEEAKTSSHFQKGILKIGDFLIITAVILVGIVFVAAIIRNESLLKIIQFALVLVVAAIPVALPAVLTVTMAIGANTLAKKEAIVSKLTSIQEIAGVDILCSDKTGTITKNELTVAETVSFENFNEDDIFLSGLLASREEDKDPIDNAIIEKAKKLKSIKDTLQNYIIVDFIPFDPVSKRTEAIISESGKRQFRVSKGAPQAILSLISDKQIISPIINEIVNKFAEKGYRALGVARTNTENKWKYLGIFALYDPPREDSKETIIKAQSMGIAVKMVTGDHIAVAKTIANQVHLNTNIISADLLKDKSEDELREIVDNVDGFAQVFPEHKYKIIEIYQNEGHFVAMTGDGVNDAPALKKANTGIAVAGAIDAAKSSADIVLTKPGLSVIIDTIRESRKIFSRMSNYSIYRVAETIRVLIFLTLSILIFNFYPITPVMIVILAILNDVPIMMIAYDNVRIHSRPVRWDMHNLLFIALILGFFGVVASFLLFWIGETLLLLPREVIQTLIFLKLTVAGHMTIYLVRTGKNHFWTKPFPSAKLFLTAEATQLLGTIIAVYGIFMIPLGWALAGFVWLYAFIFFFMTDFLKVYLFRK